VTPDSGAGTSGRAQASSSPGVDATVRHLALTRLLAAPMALDRGGAIAVTVRSHAAHMNLK
jgi:hypothetical protein